MLSELAFSLLFEKEVDGDRASRGRRSYGQALADPEHERRSDEAYQALIVKQVPGPISFTSAEGPCRTAVLKAFHEICLLPNSPGGILLRRQDLDLVLTVLQMVANMEPVQLIGFSFVSPSATSSIGKVLPIIMPGELADINGHHLAMGLREMFSPCILDNFIAEYYDRITSTAIDHSNGDLRGDSNAAARRLTSRVERAKHSPPWARAGVARPPGKKATTWHAYQYRLGRDLGDADGTFV
jgi:hypothetical protein